MASPSRPRAATVVDSNFGLMDWHGAMQVVSSSILGQAGLLFVFVLFSFIMSNIKTDGLPERTPSDERIDRALL